MQRTEIHSDDRKSGLIWLFISLLILVFFSLAFAYIPVPESIIGAANVLIMAVFLAFAIFGIYRGADHPWTPKLAIGFVLAGVVVQAGFLLLSRMVFGTGFLGALSFAVSQSGFILWTIGLGALLTTMLKDKNLLIPVSIFLAAFDIFLVLTPIGITSKIMRSAPEVLPTVGLTLPKAQSTPGIGVISPSAYIGPADFVFMAMFFVALYRFNMRTKETLIALVPTLLVYLLIVFFVGPLPALVPIGLCVLIVNFGEFKLNKEEWASTALITAIVTGIIIFGATRPKPKLEPAGGPSYPGEIESTSPPTSGVPGLPQR